MSDVVVEGGMLRLDGRSVPLAAGEIQFWRMDPETWEPVVRAARDAGVNIVSTYLSWRRHEPVQGQTDFTGDSDPRLDVRGFLEVCSDVGVLVQLKPGPWICAEEPGGGYPDWLLENDELLARDDRGEKVVGYNPPFQHPVPSYTNSAYLSAVRRWFATVWEAVGDFRYPAGPIVAVQLDNEPSSCFQDAMYGADYSDSSVAAFRSWLSDKYEGELERLRNAWADPTVSNFFAAAPPLRPNDHGVGAQRQRMHDWIAFKTHYTATYLAELRQIHASLGAGHLLFTVNLVTHPVHDVPVSHSSIRRLTTAATGEDHYYIPPLDTADIHRLARSAATARAAGEPVPWVPELQAGIWRSPGETVDYPDPTPVEQEIWWGAAIALGFGGFNMYMLADRENWEFSPLTADGARAASFAPVERLLTLVEREPGALTASPYAGVVVAWHRPDAYNAYTVAGTSRIATVDWFDEESYRPYREWDETLQHLAELGIVYDLWDTAESLSSPMSAPLIVPAGCTIERRLLDDVRSTGRVVVELEPDTTAHDLADLLPDSPRVVSAGGDLLDQTMVSIRTIGSRELIHLVHWGPGARHATLRLPGVPDGQLTHLLTSASADLRNHRAYLPVTRGHHTFVLERTPTDPGRS